ncbi:MAG: hypothetical protein D6751_12725 [Deltaproteobacteria bacterium]|nr:MAG: hypothetical protein D6751_12725 [Deltaproteobacteria bacterium]
MPGGTGGPVGDQAQKLIDALRADDERLWHLLQDSDRQVLLNLLKNPALNEEHLLALLRRRDLDEEILKKLYQARREGASHRVLVAMARHPNLPAPMALALLPHLYLFELLDICLLPGHTSDQRIAAERQIVKRLPEIPLGQKITLARRATPGILAALVGEGRAQTLAACLDNPHLKEAALLQFLRGANASADTISMIARHPRWQNRPQLRLAILKHPRTPMVWYLAWKRQLNRAQISELLASRRLPASRRRQLQELFRSGSRR